jgi:O-methyltransferase
MSHNFEEMFNEIVPKFDHCLLGHAKTKFLYEEFISIGVKGNTAEIGVFNGVTSKIIALLNGDNKHICYDTFEGVVHADETIDLHKNGDFFYDLESVKRNISLSNVIYKKGVFPETFSEYDMEFVFVHSDTDTYYGTKATFDKFANIMCIGGKILCDDYKWQNCPGVEKAVKEFHSLNQKLFDFKECGNQCVLTKIAN